MRSLSGVRTCWRALLVAERRGGGDGLAAGCWAASGKKGKRAGLGCRLGLGRVGVGFGLGSFLYLSPF